MSRKKTTESRELCLLRNDFQKTRKNLERQITALKEKYKKDKREIKAKNKRIKQAKKEVRQMREQLTEALPERREEEFRIAFLNRYHPRYNEDKETEEDEQLDRAI